MSRPTPTGKIPCILFAYNNPDIAEQALESVYTASDLLEIYVIELMSPSTEARMKPLLESAVRSGKVHKYILFDENISNNSANIVLDMFFDEIFNSQFILMSDLDIMIEPASIYEQIAIMLANSDVFACGTQVDMSGWQESYNEVADILRDGIAKAGELNTSYIEHWSGMWMTMFRTIELLEVIRTMDKNGYRLADGTINRFGKLILRKKWVITRYSKARDLNRESTAAEYALDAEDSRSRLKKSSPEEGRYALFNHNRVCGGVIFDRDGHHRFSGKPMMRPAVSRHRRIWDEDPLYRLIVNGTLIFEEAIVVGSPPKLQDPAGLYVWIHPADQTPNSIPYFGEDKAILHVGRENLPPGLKDVVPSVYIPHAFESEVQDGVYHNMRIARHLLKPQGRVHGWIWSNKGDERRERLAVLKEAFKAARLPTPTWTEARPWYRMPKRALPFRAGK